MFLRICSSLAPRRRALISPHTVMRVLRIHALPPQTPGLFCTQLGVVFPFADMATSSPDYYRSPALRLASRIRLDNADEPIGQIEHHRHGVVDALRERGHVVLVACARDNPGMRLLLVQSLIVAMIVGQDRSALRGCIGHYLGVAQASATRFLHGKNLVAQVAEDLHHGARKSSSA